MRMVRNLFHSIEHLLGWNRVKPGVYQHNYNRFVGVKCMGCGLVRKEGSNQYFVAEEVCFYSSHQSHMEPIVGCLENLKGK